MNDRVWDPAVRVSHWVLAAAVVTCWWTGREGMMDIHLVSGYVVLGTLVFRLAWGFAGSDTARFLRFPIGPRRVAHYFRSFHRRDGSAWRGHNPGGALMVLFMLAFFGGQATLGLVTTDDILVQGPLVAAMPSSLVDRASDLHRDLGDWTPYIVGLHVVVVLFYVVWKRQPLVRAMVTGRRPATVDGQPASDLRFASMRRAAALAITAALAVTTLVQWGRSLGF